MRMFDTWFVESDMPVFTNTAKEKFNSPVTFDLPLVCVTFFDQVFGISVKNIDLRSWNVNCLTDKLGCE